MSSHLWTDVVLAGVWFNFGYAYGYWIHRRFDK